MKPMMTTPGYFRTSFETLSSEQVHFDMRATDFRVEDLYRFASSIQQPACTVLEELGVEPSVDALEAMDAALRDLVNIHYLRLIADEVERVDYHTVVVAARANAGPGLVEGACCKQVSQICLTGYLAFIHEGHGVSFRKTAERMKDAAVRAWFEAEVLPVRVTRRAADIYLMLRAGGPTAAFYDAISCYEKEAQQAFDDAIAEACADLTEA